MRVSGVLCDALIIEPPFSGVGATSGNDAENAITDGEGYGKKRAVKLSQRKATLFPVVMSRIFQGERGIGQNQYGIRKVNAVFFKIAPALAFIPLKFHVHYVTPFCSYVKMVYGAVTMPLSAPNQIHGE